MLHLISFIFLFVCIYGIVLNTEKGKEFIASIYKRNRETERFFDSVQAEETKKDIESRKTRYFDNQQSIK